MSFGQFFIGAIFVSRYSIIHTSLHHWSSMAIIVNHLRVLNFYRHLKTVLTVINEQLMLNRTWAFTKKQIALSLRLSVIPPGCLSSHQPVNHPSRIQRRWHRRNSALMKQERGNHESGAANCAHVYVAQRRWKSGEWWLMVRQRSGGRVSEMRVEWTPRNLSVEVVFPGCN